MLDKLIFLYHGGKTLPAQAVPPGTSPLPGIITILILLALMIGLWILFTRKKSI